MLTCGKGRFFTLGFLASCLWVLGLVAGSATSWAAPPSCASVHAVNGAWSETDVDLILHLEATESCEGFFVPLPSGEKETAWMMDFHLWGKVSEKKGFLILPPLSPGSHVLFLHRAYPIRCESVPVVLAERQAPLLQVGPSRCEARFDAEAKGRYQYRISDGMKDELAKHGTKTDTQVQTLSERFSATIQPQPNMKEPKTLLAGEGKLTFLYETYRDYEPSLLHRKELFEQYFQDTICPSLDWFAEMIGLGTQDFKPENAWIWYASCMRWHDGLTGYSCKSIDRYNAEQSYRNNYIRAKQQGLPDTFESEYPRHRTFDAKQLHASFDAFLRLLQSAYHPSGKASDPVLARCLSAMTTPLKPSPAIQADLRKLEAFRKSLTPEKMNTLRSTVRPKIYE